MVGFTIDITICNRCGKGKERRPSGSQTMPSWHRCYGSRASMSPKLKIASRPEGSEAMQYVAAEQLEAERVNDEREISMPN